MHRGAEGFGQPPLSRQRSQMKSLHLTMKAVLQDELPSTATEELAFQTEFLPNYTDLTYSREVLFTMLFCSGVAIVLICFVFVGEYRRAWPITSHCFGYVGFQCIP
jgi:hypothetical protein